MVKNKTKKCKIKCKDIKCGESLNKCSPVYCYPGGSKSWTKCNMKNWKGKYNKYKKYCKKEKCPKKTTKKYKKYQVLAKTLHKKMPYIWRFLTPQTRKKMILLAKKPIKEINIQKFNYPDN